MGCCPSKFGWGKAVNENGVRSREFTANKPVESKEPEAVNEEKAEVFNGLNAMEILKIVELVPYESTSDLTDLQYVDVGSDSEGDQSSEQDDQKEEETEFGIVVKTVSLFNDAGGEVGTSCIAKPTLL